MKPVNDHDNLAGDRYPDVSPVPIRQLPISIDCSISPPVIRFINGNAKPSSLYAGSLFGDLLIKMHELFRELEAEYNPVVMERERLRTEVTQLRGKVRHLETVEEGLRRELAILQEQLKKKRK